MSNQLISLKKTKNTRSEKYFESCHKYVVFIAAADFDKQQKAMKDCDQPELGTQIDIDFFNLISGLIISKKNMGPSNFF